MNKDILKNKREILLNISTASLESVEEILNYYQVSDKLEQGIIYIKPIVIDGVTYHEIYNPVVAASLNARYFELTGKNHPVFLKEQAKALDLLLKNKDELIKQGIFSFQLNLLEELKENLVQGKNNINFLNSKHPLLRIQDIMLNLQDAKLEDVKAILDCYKASDVLDCGMFNIQTTIVNGLSYHLKYNPIEAAALNARYFELTGKNHPLFLAEQAKVLNILLNNKKELIKHGYLLSYVDVLERLRKNLSNDNSDLEIVVGIEKHILNRFSNIIDNLEDASLEEIDLLLNYYNGKPIIVDGIVYHPFNDPISAFKLNQRYYDLTGENHSNYVYQVPIVIKSLMKDKKKLLKFGAYPESYFYQLEQINESIKNNMNTKSKGR